MKKLGEALLQKESFSEIMMGNSAIVRAMLEAGTRVVTSYPGSPTPEIAIALAGLPKDRNPLYFEFSVNEKVALEVAYGASINGHSSCVFFKSVGLNVAADSFVQLSMMELIGGMVVILGDDPGANSSQNEQDNRHFAYMSYIPVFEPANPQEAYEMYKEAMHLSRDRKMPIILRLTTHVCHAKQKVKFNEYIPTVFSDEPKFDAKNGPYVPITKDVFPLKRKALSKLESFKEYCETTPFNQVFHNQNEKGIITMGLPYLSLLDVLEESAFKPDILKLGVVYPLPRKMITEFLNAHKEVKILEELDDIIEREIKAIAYEEKIQTKIIGKCDLLDWENEYSAAKVQEILHKTWPDEIVFTPNKDTKKPFLSGRPAQMCPGCGHRSAFHAIRLALQDNAITVGDIGCHSLAYMEPYYMGQMLLSMGHSNGTAEGLSLFNKTRKVVSFLGDSTFFHAGLPGIINAVFNNHKHTLIIMENGTTAMTGHQDHPAVGKNFREVTEKIPVKDVLKGFGIKHIWEVDTYQQAKLTQAVKEALDMDEFTVVIAKHPCMLKFTREAKKANRPSAQPVKVTDKCNQLHICVTKFACPSYQREADGSVWIQEDLCIGDGSCKQVCPSEAIVTKSADKEV